MTDVPRQKVAGLSRSGGENPHQYLSIVQYV